MKENTKNIIIRVLEIAFLLLMRKKNSNAK